MVFQGSLLTLAIVFLAIGIGLAIAANFGLSFPYVDEVVLALIIIGFIFLAVWVILVVVNSIRGGV